MAKEATLEFEGKVIDAIKDDYKVELDNGSIVMAHVSGKMRMNYIRILPGDTVVLELSPELFESVVGC